mgnify:CR=1 FL=1
MVKRLYGDMEVMYRLESRMRQYLLDSQLNHQSISGNPTSLGRCGPGFSEFSQRKQFLANRFQIGGTGKVRV